MTLTVGTVAETVTVVGETALLDTGQAMKAMSITQEQIQELPLIGRDFLDLALMGSGVSDVATGAVAGSQSQTISGVFSRYTSYQLDGFNNTRDQHGVQKADVSLDAIAEFSVLSNQFSAEYGQSMSGIVSVITKSGTNDLHGSGFLFVRPGSWDARDRLTGLRAPYDRQDTGFTFGGPLRRNQTHFFSSFEYRNEDEQAVVTATIDNGKYRGTFPIGSNRTRFMTKVNHRFNDNNLLEGSFIIGDETGESGIGGLTVADNPTVVDQRRHHVPEHLHDAHVESCRQRGQVRVFERGLQLDPRGDDADRGRRRAHLSGRRRPSPATRRRPRPTG